MEQLIESGIISQIIGQAISLVVGAIIVILVVWLINKPFEFLDNMSIWQKLRGSLVDDFKGELDEIKNSIIAVNDKLDNHIADSEERHAKQCRLDILDFNEEIIMGLAHTEEHYQEVLDIIDKYERYCKDHPNFPNNKCVLACENIKESFREFEKKLAKENSKKVVKRKRTK